MGGGDLAIFGFIQEALQTGLRPPVPPMVELDHRDFVACMQLCWASDPAHRPLFKEVVPVLASCLRRFSKESTIEAGAHFFEDGAQSNEQPHYDAEECVP